MVDELGGGLVLLTIEGDSHPGIPGLVWTKGGCEEAHLALGDVGSRHAPLNAPHPHTDSKLATSHEATPEHTHRRTANCGSTGRAQAVSGIRSKVTEGADL